MEALREILSRLCELLYHSTHDVGVVLYNLDVIESPEVNQGLQEQHEVRAYALRCLKQLGDYEFRTRLPSLVEHFTVKGQLGEIDFGSFWGQDYERCMQQLHARTSVLDGHGWVVFASLAKPRLQFQLATRTAIDPTGNTLILSGPVPLEGVTVNYLREWWRTRGGTGKLVDRFRRSIASNATAELRVFEYFYEQYYHLTRDQFPDDCLPALLPQVWLNYDPQTRQQRAGQEYLDSQRVDFALVLPGRRWVVMEIDGPSHFSAGQTPSLAMYESTIRATRNYLLDGIECYRFGNSEILGRDGEDLLHAFWDKLFSA